MSVRKIGVEEELLLVDPSTGHLTAVAESAVLANETAEEVEQELFLQQIETSTPPCEKADDLVAGIVAGRRAVGRAAAAAGARAVAVGTPVLAEDDEDFTPKSRYRRIQHEYGEMARQALVCAMHMHVDVDDDEEAVRVVDRIRPWLPLLVATGRQLAVLAGPRHRPRQLALPGVEPLADGRVRRSPSATWRPTARCRSRCSSGAPGWTPGCSTSTSGSPQRLPDRRDPGRRRLHRRRGRRARRAAGPGAGQPPSPPTGRAPTWRGDLLRVAGWRAARPGLAGDLVHPVDGALAPAREVFDATVDSLPRRAGRRPATSSG